MTTTKTEMAKMMARQPEDLRRLLEDREGIEAGAERLAGRRVFVVGTGTSWHAANLGAYFLRRARVDALSVSAADCAEWGPRPTPADGLVLLSHRGTKRYTREVLERARADGVPTVAIGGVGAPGADIETVAQETSGTFTASHLGALSRLAQLAQALGAELGELEAVPAAVAAALDGPSPAVELPERGLEFVGAGPNQWTAAEGSLKVRESAHVFAEGLAVEQLLHGPGFALDGRDALVSLDGGGPGAPRLAELVNAIESRGTRIYRFSASELGEPLSVFPLTVVVQRIALDFAVQLGTDPDDVRPAEWKAIDI
jgi:glucosamine--fructose-6-phosphate aminotransferase (isomerizing)